jgi:electron transfer flavoprotein beta subunit
VTVETDLPAVVTIAPGALKPRYPDGARLINVYRGEGGMAEALETWDVSDLVASTELAPLIEERGQDFPPERELGERLSGPPEEMAQALADVLQQRLRG